MPELDAEFLTVAEVADRLRLNPQTVRNWIDAGKLPALRAGRRVRIRPADVDAFLEPAGLRVIEDMAARRDSLSEALNGAQTAETDAELAQALRTLAQAASALARALERR